MTIPPLAVADDETGQSGNDPLRRWRGRGDDGKQPDTEGEADVPA